jgi:L-threonylcarbamoyladenylate synthase
VSVHPLITADVELAARLLGSGGLVGMPTETVYGLAADASDVAAVARVFAVKGRPADHPLIVHLAGAEELDAWAREVPGYARKLADQLWPGPLTLVLPRTPRAGDHLTGGQPTVGLRVPAHPVTRHLLAEYGRGLAAPSANRFGRVSPTTAGHVIEELGELLVPGQDAVLDGGPSEVGVESAIIDCTGPNPVILRPGAVTAADIARVGGAVVADRPSRVRAPGMLASHYAPGPRSSSWTSSPTSPSAHWPSCAPGVGHCRPGVGAHSGPWCGCPRSLDVGPATPGRFYTALRRRTRSG